MQYRVISPRITSLLASQTSPVVLCKQNNVISIRITTLYGSKPSFVVFACKTASFGPEIQVSLGTRPHLWFLAFKTATLEPELHISMGLSPHLLFLHSKQRLYNQNCYSLWVPVLICGFCMQNSGFWIRITNLYGVSDLTYGFWHSKQRL